MPRLPVRWLLLCWLMVFQSNVGSPQREANAHQKIEQAFSSGKMVVLVVAPQKSAGDEESEAYGDWADNLNGFASSLPADTKIVKLTAAQYKQDVEEPKIRRPFATLFLRDSTHALLHDGMIVEAKAYKIGLDWLHQQQQDEKTIAAYGFREQPAKLK